jgi:hypothetical protein
MRRLWALWLRTPGMRLDIEQAGEAQHGYLIGDFARYATLVEEVFAARAARGAG